MARVECPEVVQDDAGNAISGADVYIYNRGTVVGTSIYAAAVGGAPLSQPRSTDQHGRIPAYVEPGSYDIVTVVAGVTQQTQEWEAVSAQSAVASSGFIATAKWLVD